MRELQDRFNPLISRKNTYQPSVRRIKRYDNESIFLLVFRALGDISRWEEVCLLNNIEDPTDLPEEILLPNG